MKVLMLNGSCNAGGSTQAGLDIMAKVFAQQGVETEIVRVGGKPVADCKAEVNFTLSDSGAIQTALLDSAAKNARKKAETLCAALGAKLGELVKIDYNWSEIDIYSHTRYGSGIICGAPAPGCAAPEIDPEDIKLNDTATFVWQIG
jgi:uncharacterized protein YggE